MSMLAEIRCPLVLAVPNQNHRCTYSDNDEQIILCRLVGSHKFKPKSQYNGCVFNVVDSENCTIASTRYHSGDFE